MYNKHKMGGWMEECSAVPFLYLERRQMKSALRGLLLNLVDYTGFSKGRWWAAESSWLVA